MNGRTTRPCPPFWRGENEADDRRLAPCEPDVSTYTFPNAVRKLRVRLIYRPVSGTELAAVALPEPALLRPLAEYERAVGGGWS